MTGGNGNDGIDTGESAFVSGQFDEYAQLLRVLAHPVRLRILEMLLRRSRCVKHLNSLLPISQPHLSQHIAALRQAQLIDCHSNGTLRCYYLLKPLLVEVLLRALMTEHPAVYRDHDEVVDEVAADDGVE
ncbi:winged helix-turn-helix transcriptional regulator [bacterium]|nr:winged helix-turn-helix transcriptional regulator [candidate division CSSED10-310 bacterium]